MRIDTKFDANAYWSSLVVGKDVLDVSEVGHPDMGGTFNRLAYDLRLRSVTRSLRLARITLSHASVFEAAFGVGYYLRFWSRSNCRRVAGIELSEQAWRNVSKKFPRFDLRWGDLKDIEKWPDFSSLVDSFNVVTAIDVLYHLVDDSGAELALVGLSKLVAPDGVLLITEKFAVKDRSFRESRHVTRRSEQWYSSLLERQGFVLERLVPIFWCMDPPATDCMDRMSARLAHMCWTVMRAGIKYWPRNGRAQNLAAGILGRMGYALDTRIVGSTNRTPNLMIATYRKVAPDRLC